MHNESLIGFFIGIGITLIVFLICREVICWYWKINKIVELLERQNELLEKNLKSKN